MPLSDLVLSRLTRLGATLPARWNEPTQLDGAELPEPLRQLAGVTWPENVAFRNDDSDDLWVWGLELGGLARLDTNDIAIEHDGPLAILGDADGGNVLVVVRMDDPDPTDPVVYKVDHDDPEQTLFGDVRLSRFLASLRPEGTVEAKLPAITAVDAKIMSVLQPTVDWRRIGEASEALRPRDVAPLVAYYQSLADDWERKVAVVLIVSKSKDRALEPVMLDILQAPEGVDDSLPYAQVDALVFLTGNAALRKDHDAALRGIGPYLASRGLG